MESGKKENERSGHSEMVPIFVMGKRYDVPASLTIQKAMEYAGYQWIRGCGCRGGICGACATVYRFPESYKIEVGLACQTVVQPNMYITQIPFFPAVKKTYDLEKLTPTLETLVKLYPETLRCLQCNVCTKSCPMDIQVMDYMAAAMRGDIERVAELSFSCVMCGLCTSRCPAEICQYNIAILARRLYGKYMTPKAEHLQAVIEEITKGRYDSMMTELMETDEERLKKLYTEREIEPEEADEMWTPKDTSRL
ncbi:MAG: 4Fe-4S dicluster domain-containing protein [Deltaproteobacteria bacterium]|nr:4Fe-4S dicluster domain-containing protein [Deltaproteobacteria bacterium]MBW2123567.1 4Fe-4S dicluster domain-containing protein [Deltaproteobacteria bacterium]